MNKKAFVVALIFLFVTLVWLGINIYWTIFSQNCIADLLFAILFVLAGLGMVWNESHKKKRRHLDEINKHKIP